MHEVFEVPLFEETYSAQKKNSGCMPVTFNFNFHPNFHLNILGFANLPIHRKLIHDNISLVF